MGAEETAPGPTAPARRDTWSLRTLVRDVSGRSLEEFQEPGRAPHPYLSVKPPPGAATPSAPAPVGNGPEEPTIDPVLRVYPPLVGPIGRALHG
ncbi:MAG: hypothetical protein ACREC5_07755, partial [Thermoplasmata archaeon]